MFGGFFYGQRGVAAIVFLLVNPVPVADFRVGRDVDRLVLLAQVEALRVFYLASDTYVKRLSRLVACHLPVIHCALYLNGSTVRFCTLLLADLTALAGVLAGSLRQCGKTCEQKT